MQDLTTSWLHPLIYKKKLIYLFSFFLKTKLQSNPPSSAELESCLFLGMCNEIQICMPFSAKECPAKPHKLYFKEKRVFETQSTSGCSKVGKLLFVCSCFLVWKVVFVCFFVFVIPDVSESLLKPCEPNNAYFLHDALAWRSYFYEWDEEE